MQWEQLSAVVRSPGIGGAMTHAHPHGVYLRWVKPTIDMVGGILLSLLTAPLIVLLAVAVLFSMGWPVIFTQRRVGKDGRVFRVYKFRSMEPDRRTGRQGYEGPDRRLSHKDPTDPRLTPVGRFLRKWSLDELPQLWNVVFGQMSLVGPRPELEEIVVRHYAPWQHQRHLVTPGVTGSWQISQRGDGQMHEHTEVDIDYVREVSLATDLKILLLTIPAALGKRPGA